MGSKDQQYYQSFTENVQQVDDRLSKVLKLDIREDIKDDVSKFLAALRQWKAHPITC